MSHNDKKRKKERKARNAAARASVTDTKGAEGRDRWQGQVSFQLGKDPRTRLNLEFSGVKIPVDDPSDMEGVVELTTLARSKDAARN